MIIVAVQYCDDVDYTALLSMTLMEVTSQFDAQQLKTESLVTGYADSSWLL